MIQGSLLLAGLDLPASGILAASEAQQAEILAAADLELRLERVRRDTAPDAPSRLSCCVLEQTPQSQLSSNVVVVVETMIRQLAVYPSWLEGNVLTLTDTDLSNYWLGITPENKSAEDKLQILFDGLVVTVNRTRTSTSMDN